MRTVALFFCLAFTAAGQTYQVNGIVVDHLSNRPLNHVLVHLGSMAKEGGSVSALTENDGRFSFTNVPPGKYRLTAQRRGEIPQQFRADEAGYATAIAVGPAKVTENLIFPLHANSAISGLVIDDQGEPVSNAQVHLFGQTVVNGAAQTSQRGVQITNSAGQFRFGHLRAATYFVAVVGRPWYATFFPPNQRKTDAPRDTDVSYPVTWYGNTTEGEAASPIALTEGSTLNVEIDLRAAPNVHIKLPATLSQQDGNIALSVRGPSGVRVPLGANTSNSNGIRELTGTPAGRYEVSLNQFTKGQPRVLGSETLDLTDGATLSMPAPSQVSVKGQVIFSGERSTKDLEIYLNGAVASSMAEVGADGSFSFPPERLTAGSFTIHLNAPDLVIQSITAHGARYVNGKLEIPSSGNVALSIVTAPADRLTKIEGIATAPGALVLLVPRDLNEAELFKRDQSDSDGSFSIAAVPPGHYTLIAIDDGSNLLYKTPSVIKPYLANGASIVVPPATADHVKVAVQKRRPN